MLSCVFALSMILSVMLTQYCSDVDSEIPLTNHVLLRFLLLWCFDATGSGNAVLHVEMDLWVPAYTQFCLDCVCIFFPLLFLNNTRTHLRCFYTIQMLCIHLFTK